MRYTAAFVADMLTRHPNLYFDVSCSNPLSLWPRNNGQMVSRMWDDQRRHLRPEWVDVVRRFPNRFLAALDLGSDRITLMNLKTSTELLRAFLDELPPGVRARIAYRNAWKLLFHEEF